MSHENIKQNIPLSTSDAKLDNDRNIEVPIKVKYTKNIDPNALYYDLTGKRLAVIFNHCRFFQKRYSDRPGTDEDAERLNECLSRLNFSCKLYENSTAKEIELIMETVGNLKPENLSCLIVVVMTHGSNEYLAAYDVDYQKSTLWEKISGKLIGIPKLYFIQACRGGSVDKGIEVTDSIRDVTDNVRFTLPKNADLLQMYSSYEGYISWKEEQGSWFIQTLCNVFDEKSKEWDLLQMLTFVTKKVAVDYKTKTRDDHTNESKAVPQIVSTLTKFLKFNVMHIQ